MAKYLVTGAAGFIGSHLVETLLEKGDEVVGLDNFCSGKRENLSFLNSREDISKFRLIEGDILNLETCLEAVSGCDFVLHQAALGSVPRSMEYPLLFHQNNVTGTVNMLEAARQKGIKRFVFASSSSVYGDASVSPKIESMVPMPFSPYAVTKLTGEIYCKLYYQAYGLPTVALRYFNVFGPRQNPESDYAAVIPRFISALQKNDAPKIYGDGHQTRDFTYVGNVCLANIQACLASENVFGCSFNIGSFEQHSVNALMDRLKQMLHSSITPDYLPARRGDVKDSLASIVAAQKFLSYSVVFPFFEGLSKTVDWFQNNTN